MKTILLFLFYLVFIYIVISAIEWFAHYYFMHYNGSLKTFMDYCNIKRTNKHIDHHIETKLDQTLPNNFIEEALVFNIFNADMIFVIIFVTIGSIVFWYYFPGFKKKISLLFIIIIIIIILNLYMVVWSSIHSHYHERYIEANKPLKNNPNITVYSIFDFFIPNESSSIYKYLYWYHTLHHLNKGEDKVNYNIILPLFDFILGTYKSTVNNTNHFSKNDTNGIRDEWLKKHLVFDVRVLDNNVLEYKDVGTYEWHKLPDL
jgi:hypothetical protein